MFAKTGKARAVARLAAVCIWGGCLAPSAALAQSAPPATGPATGVLDDPCAPTIPAAANRDIANLCRYADANRALIASATPVRAVFMGDSITDSWGPADPALFSQGVIDRGISGQTTGQMLLRFRQDVIALKPQVVHILAGTNDIAGNMGPTSLAAIEDNIATMAELARAHHIRVVIGAVLPASRYGWRPEIVPTQTIVQLNAFLASYAQAQHLTYVDYWHLLANPAGGMDPSNAADGVHPTPAAYAAMRPLAQAAIHQTLRRDTRHGHSN